MKTIGILLVAAAALAVAPAAFAKEISQLQACGASGCATLKDRGLLMQVGEGSDGTTPTDTPAPAASFRLVYTVEAGKGESFEDGKTSFTFTVWYVPGARATRGTSETGYAIWQTVTPTFVATMERLTRGLKPFPAPRITQVTIGGKPVADPQSYVRLLTLPSKLDELPGAADWKQVRFRSAQPSAWTDGARLVDFSADSGYISRDNVYTKLPSGLAADVRAGRSLASRGGGFPWTWLGVGLAVAAAAAAVIVVGRRGHGSVVAKPSTT